MTKFIRENKNLMQAIAFWALFVFLVGFGSGLASSKLIWDYKVNEIIKTKAALVGNTVYEIKERP